MRGAGGGLNGGHIQSDWDEDERGGMCLRPCAPTRQQRQHDQGFDRLDNLDRRAGGNGDVSGGGSNSRRNSAAGRGYGRGRGGDSKRLRGVVVSIRDSEGFGFVKSDAIFGQQVGSDIFFHLGSGLERGTHPDELWVGAAVEFTLAEGRETKPRAVNLRLAPISDPTASLRPVQAGVGVGREVFPSGGVGCMAASLGGMGDSSSSSRGMGTSNGVAHGRIGGTGSGSGKASGVGGVGRVNGMGKGAGRNGSGARGGSSTIGGLREIQSQQQVASRHFYAISSRASADRGNAGCKAEQTQSPPCPSTPARHISPIVILRSQAIKQTLAVALPSVNVDTRPLAFLLRASEERVIDALLEDCFDASVLRQGLSIPKVRCILRIA